MASLTPYRGPQVVSPDPTDPGGLAIQNDLKSLVNWSPRSDWSQSSQGGPGYCVFAATWVASPQEIVVLSENEQKVGSNRRSGSAWRAKNREKTGKNGLGELAGICSIIVFVSDLSWRRVIREGARHASH